MGLSPVRYKTFNILYEYCTYFMVFLIYLFFWQISVEGAGFVLARRLFDVWLLRLSVGRSRIDAVHQGEHDIVQKGLLQVLMADTSHTVWCYYWLTGFTGCLAIRACVRLASRTYRRSRWSWGPVATCTTWSVSRANSAITGNNKPL